MAKASDDAGVRYVLPAYPASGWGEQPWGTSAYGGELGTQLGGGIAWPCPTLSDRHWSAPPSSLRIPSIAGVARPAGASAVALAGKAKGHGIINPTDDDLQWILAAAVAADAFCPREDSEFMAKSLALILAKADDECGCYDGGKKRG